MKMARSENHALPIIHRSLARRVILSGIALPHRLLAINPKPASVCFSLLVTPDNPLTRRIEEMHVLGLH